MPRTEGPTIGDLRADRGAATSAWCDGPLSACQPALFAADFGRFVPTKAQCPAALAECGLDDDVRPLRKSEPRVQVPLQVGHSNNGGVDLSIFNTTAGPPSGAAFKCLHVAKHCSYLDFPSHPSGFVGTPEDGTVTLSIEGTSLFGCVILLQDQAWGWSKPWKVPNMFASLLSSSSSLHRAARSRALSMRPRPAAASSAITCRYTICHLQVANWKAGELAIKVNGKACKPPTCRYGKQADIMC